TDIYALGVVLYEMLTGRVPFRGEGFAEVLVQALNTAPVPPSAIAPGIPPHVERAVLRALAKRPEDRFLRVGDLAAALQDPAWGISAAFGAPPGAPVRSGAFAAAPPGHGGAFAATPPGGPVRSGAFTAASPGAPVCSGAVVAAPQPYDPRGSAH